MLGPNVIVVGLVLALAVGSSIAQENCIQCTSETEVRCASHPHYLTPTQCANTTSAGCFARIVDGHTVRGCVSALDQNECVNSNLCNTCYNVNTGQGCNNQIYPVIRLFCHQCQGLLNSTCAEEQTTSAELCTIYEESNRCFIRRSNETIVRGCLSSSGTNCTTPEHCLPCDGSGCNLLIHSDPSIPLAPSSATMLTMSMCLLAAFTLAATIAH